MMSEPQTIQFARGKLRFTDFSFHPVFELQIDDEYYAETLLSVIKLIGVQFSQIDFFPPNPQKHQYSVIRFTQKLGQDESHEWLGELSQHLAPLLPDHENVLKECLKKSKSDSADSKAQK